MIDNNNTKKIGEEMGKIIEQNIIPKFDEIRGQLNKIEATMVTKSYLDDTLADLEGNLIVKLRKEDAKMNPLTEVLKNKSVLNEDDIKIFDEFQIFPKLR